MAYKFGFFNFYKTSGSTVFAVDWYHCFGIFISLIKKLNLLLFKLQNCFKKITTNNFTARDKFSTASSMSSRVCGMAEFLHEQKENFEMFERISLFSFVCILFYFTLYHTKKGCGMNLQIFILPIAIIRNANISNRPFYPMPFHPMPTLICPIVKITKTTIFPTI